MSKLSEKDIIDIRERAVDGESYPSIAEDYGLSASYTRKIARGLVRTDQRGPIEQGNREMGRKRSITEKGIIDIRERASSGEDYTSIADDYGCSHHTIKKIAIGRSYADIGGPITKRKNFEAVLTSDAVAWARRQKREHGRDVSYASLSQRLKEERGIEVSRQGLAAAVTGKTWTHVDEPPVK